MDRQTGSHGGSQQLEEKVEMVRVQKNVFKLNLVEEADAHFLLHVDLLQHLHELIEGDGVVSVGVCLLDGSVCDAAELLV